MACKIRIRVKSRPQSNAILQGNADQPPSRQEERQMKKRWMKSVIETSRQTMPPLPYTRKARTAAPAPSPRELRSA